MPEKVSRPPICQATHTCSVPIVTHFNPSDWDMHCSQCRVLFVLLGIIVMSHIFVLILPCVQFFTGESIFLYVNVILCRNLLPSLVKESAEAASSSEGPLFPCQCAQHKGVLFGMSSGRMWPVQTHCLPHGCW